MKLDVISITRPEPRLHIILCHGFGATNQDLLDLAAWLDPEKGHNWHFPQAPIAIPGMQGYAWFPRTMPELIKTLNGEYFARLETITDPGLPASADELAQWIETQKIPQGRLVIGGFSQGSMVALQLAISGKVHPAALVILSGGLVNRSQTEALVRQAQAIPVFQSHGRQDQVLALDGAISLRKVLESAAFPLSWCEFSGGHEINALVLDQMGVFLNSLNANPRS